MEQWAGEVGHTIAPLPSRVKNPRCPFRPPLAGRDPQQARDDTYQYGLDRMPDGLRTRFPA